MPENRPTSQQHQMRIACRSLAIGMMALFIAFMTMAISDQRDLPCESQSFRQQALTECGEWQTAVGVGR